MTRFFAPLAVGFLIVVVCVQACDLSQTLLHPRFAVENVKPDGSIKIRPVDNFSWSTLGKEGSVNGHVHPCEKLKHDTLDMLVEVFCVRSCVSPHVLLSFAEAMVLFVTCAGVVPGLWKADIDSAYRRVPVACCDRWMCGECGNGHWAFDDIADPSHI